MTRHTECFWLARRASAGVTQLSPLNSRSAALRFGWTVVTSGTLNLVKKPRAHKICAVNWRVEKMSDNEIWKVFLILGHKNATALNFSRGVSLYGVGAASDHATVETISADQSSFGLAIVYHQGRRSGQPLIGRHWNALTQNWNAR